MKTLIVATLCAAMASITALAAAAEPIPTVKHVDLQRFMGRWYVIASIPTRMEREGYNAVEHYTLEDNGEVCTRFRLRQGGFRQPVKQISSTGEVRDGTGNAQWSIKLYWLLHLQYKVAWLSDDYQQVIVARDKRDHVWFMARNPQVSDADYQAMLQRVAAMGYDTSKLVKVPQQWPEPYTSPEDEKAKSCD